MKIKNKIYYLSASAFLFPVLSFAALDNVKTLVGDIGQIMNSVYYMLFTLAFVYFMWNMSQVVLKSGDPKAKEESRNKMVWGIVALFVMFSIYGIIAWIGASLNITPGGGVGGGDGGGNPSMCENNPTDPNCIGG
ncbi:MAG: hypothetical protein WAW92_01620 [Minisyncoccia bacterium]